jgi:hypothetical protein
MKLRKQAPAKAFIVAATAGLLFAFLGLVKSEPRTKSEAASAPATAPPSVDYQRFFAPAGGQVGAGSINPQPPLQVHTRTRAS